MKTELLALFDNKILNEAADRFGLERSSLRKLDGFENVVMEATRDDAPCILRISHNSHRTLNQVQAELDWIDYLSGHGVSVCKPIRSRGDRLAEGLNANGSQFVAVVFEKAPGSIVLREGWTPRMTYNRGRLLGRIHALTKEYDPPAGAPRRRHWYEDDDLVNHRDYLRPEDSIIADRFDELQAKLRALPIDHDSHGLIHMDAHVGNMHFDGDQPILFDFDDCSYDFFISDLAISLFYAVLMYGDGREAFARDFLGRLLEGYRAENSLDRRWREVIPMILKRREIVLFVAIHHGYNDDQFDAWCRRYLDGRKERIRDRVPFLDLDWSQFDLGR